MSYEIKIPLFEGPFDLLLFFIERDEIDIMDIPISEITRDFLEYISDLEKMNIEVASEFIVVAATLMRIKAKMLLPRLSLDEDGNETSPNTKGSLVIRNPWPGMLLGLWKDTEKYKQVYWSKFDSVYYPGDYAIKDSDGYLWLLGRSDDVLKVAGHRIGTAELESSIVSHNDVAESAVCGIPDDVKGESIIAFVMLKENINTSEEQLRSELRETIRTQIGPIATPSQFYFVNKLPKTRSGKIMRRLLKDISEERKLGDVTTLANADIVSELQTRSQDSDED